MIGQSFQTRCVVYVVYIVKNFDCFKIIPKFSLSVLISVFPAIAFIFHNPKY